MPLLGFLGSGQQAISLLIKRKKKMATTSDLIHNFRDKKTGNGDLVFSSLYRVRPTFDELSMAQALSVA